jgi:hypothetical protein
MIYREFLVMRKALLWYFGILIGLWIAGLALTITQQHTGDNNTDLGSIAVGGAWAVCVFAAIFGVALGNASREPARVLWVLPLERWKSALSVLAVDALGVAIAFVGSTILAVSFFLVLGLFLPSHLRGSIDWNVTFQSLLFVYAVYGWSAVVGMIGRRVAYVGIASLPLLLMWMMFGSMGGVFGTALRAPIAANPFAVYTSGFLVASPHEAPHLGTIGQSLLWMANGWETPILAATALVACAIAVVLWQRSEVLA